MHSSTLTTFYFMAIFFAKVNATCDKIPEFIGKFFIEQIDTKTVNVSLRDSSINSDCVFSINIKFWEKNEEINTKQSKNLNYSTNSVIINLVKPEINYLFQFVAYYNDPGDDSFGVKMIESPIKEFKTTKDSQQAVTTVTITNETNVTSNDTTCEIKGLPTYE